MFHFTNSLSGAYGHNHRSIKLSVLISTSILMSSCTSALKKQCESTNWFEHGYAVAMSGKPLNSDDLSRNCKKEDYPISESQLDLGFKAGMANYCKPEIVFETGKKGEKLNLEFCNPSEERKLTAKHQEGVAVFCDPSNGYPVGTSGRLYNNICPKNLEKPFLKEFTRGRKVYLAQSILEKEAQVNDLESSVSHHESEKNRLMLELATLPSGSVTTRQSVYDPNTRSYHEQTVTQADPNTESRRNSLKWDIDRENSSIRDIRSKQSTLRAQILEMKREKESIE